MIICAYYFVRIRGCYQLSSSEETSIRKSLCRSPMLVSSEKFGGTKWSYLENLSYGILLFLGYYSKKGGGIYRLLLLRRNLLSWKGQKRFLVLHEDLLYRYWNFLFFRILVGKKWSVLFIPPFFFSRNYCMEDFCEEVCYVKGWKRASYIRGSVVWSRYWNIIWKERRMYYFSWKFSCERNLLYERMENLNFLYCNKIFIYIGNFFP